jgi:hypothetical protein
VGDLKQAGNTSQQSSQNKSGNRREGPIVLQVITASGKRSPIGGEVARGDRERVFWMESGKLRKLWKLQAWLWTHGMN